MNPFKSDSAPYVATLLISALGWFLTTLHGEIRSTPVLTYETGLKDGWLTLEVRNVSTTAVVSNAYIALLCPPKQPECVRPLNPSEPSSPSYGELQFVRPTGDRLNIFNADKTHIFAWVTLPAGGRTRLRTPYGGQAPDFYYFNIWPYDLPDLAPGAARPISTPIQVIDARSPKGLFIVHYEKLLGVFFALISGALGVWLIHNLFMRAEKETKRETTALDVVLRLDDGPAGERPGLDGPAPREGGPGGHGPAGEEHHQPQAR